MVHRIVVPALIIAMILSIGCYWRQSKSPWPAVSFAAVAKDNSGGAIVVYEVYESYKSDACKRYLYSQRIDSTGQFLWVEKGVLMSAGYNEGCGPGDLRIVEDGSGGAIIAWSAYPTEPDWNLPYDQRQVPYVDSVAKIDSQGSILWRKDFPGQEMCVHKMVGDGFGGAITAVSASYPEERRLNVANLRRIDSQGNLLWGEDGVTIYFDGYTTSLEIASDNLGGAIIVWQAIAGNIFSQRIGSEGNILWQEGGLLVSSGPGGSPQLIPDSSGGAIIAYTQYTLSDGIVDYSSSDIYAQRIDADGTILWQSEGVPFYSGPLNPNSPRIVPDDSGGAVIFFKDSSIYAQRIDADGNRLWPDEGIQIWEGEEGLLGSIVHRAVADHSGEVIIVWSYNTSGSLETAIGAQKLDLMGGKLWGPDGVLMDFWANCTSPAISQYLMSEDGEGGVILSFLVVSPSTRGRHAFVQRLDAEGRCLWKHNGILLNPVDYVRVNSNWELVTSEYGQVPDGTGSGFPPHGFYADYHKWWVGPKS